MAAEKEEGRQEANVALADGDMGAVRVVAAKKEEG